MQLSFLAFSALLVLGTLSIAGVACAQDAPADSASVEPFPDVPANHWAYQAVNKLHEAGIIVGYPNAGYEVSDAREYSLLPRDSEEYTAVQAILRAGIVIGYPTGVNRFETDTRDGCVIAVARLVLLINGNRAEHPEWASIQQNLRSKLKRNPLALHAMKALVMEFKTRITQYGLDVPKALAWMDAIKSPAENLKPE